MSHYCEKARWGLDRLGIPYHEERHLQVFHYPRTYWFSHGPNVPVLIDGKRVIPDSTRILKYLDRYADPQRRLYPDDPEELAGVDELEDLFDEVLGVESRRWVYHHYRRQPVRALKTAGQGAPALEKRLAPLIYPVFALLIETMLKPTPGNVEQGLERMRAIIRKTDALLSKGERYLTGPRFTAADLSLACMMAPLVLPKNYGIRLPELDSLPEAAQPVAREFTGTDTGAYVLRLFEEDRLPSGENLRGRGGR
jgi:glutathione S-transferase